MRLYLKYVVYELSILQRVTHSVLSPNQDREA